MRFLVRHETHYRYSAPVQFAPHLLRLNPRPASVRVISRVLTVRPKPVELFEAIDVYGNQITHVAFERHSEELYVESRFEVDTLGEPPDDPGDLEPYLRNRDNDPSVRLFAAELGARTRHDPHAFLAALTQSLYGMMDRHVRPEGAARSAATTLATRRGACRDITVLFLAACRSQGLPGRFVSGYQAQAQTPDGERYLHAWAEVFVRGVGWSGWDPTHGVRVTDAHVALCAAPDQADTMPVEGSYYGPARTATLDFSVRITTS
jgi:transglutaminase-like putative cysteine protease